jgi:hypothetical protein
MAGATAAIVDHEMDAVDQNENEVGGLAFLVISI